MIEAWNKSAVQLRDAIREGELGAAALVRMYLERIARLDGRDGLNAVAEINPYAVEQAEALDASPKKEGALFGLPILVKDNVDVAGLHTTAGSLALEDNLAQTHAPVVENLIRQGAIILGKTHMTEFANYTTQGMPNGFSSQGGQVRHAYNPAWDPSGSSSGSAVAVSAGLCAMALGTDTSFSVVGCATENGVVGYKPAAGTLSAQGIVPIAPTLDSAGALARTMEDAALLCDAMAGRKPVCREGIPLEKLRLAINIHHQDWVSPEQWQRYESFLAVLTSHGMGKPQRIDQPYTAWMKDIMQYEFRESLEAYLAKSQAKRKTLASIVELYEENPGRMMPYGITYLQASLACSTKDAVYQHAMAQRALLREQTLAELAPFDACIMTGPTNIMHYVGIPSLALKLCMNDEGKPRGIILYGADEERLQTAALTMEQYCQPVLPPKL